MNRAIQLLVKSARVIKPSTRTISTTPAMNSGAWAYRSTGSHFLPKKHYMAAEFIGAVMWYWILIHLWHEPEHITGDFPYPDPSKWTNAELGIPEE
ncbi:hypothetical protein DAPPUDRAFT_309343 [Daphnia pulex]|uniref:NADH dehydrogenase [ubiquinone] 1 beta subcomplex subunit 2, mitochondrial n=1 Tax=Daphnia pulex TaxID=6669 RepID=E9HCA5_DAPPU|nr:hypothetical protein DAPPUDRAFT_309343 [Daphnia pulex]|eukprot:EFX70644.1 hypothetical protein DAPPUDRAFT_309343 [Daphnia pulex]